MDPISVAGIIVVSLILLTIPVILVISLRQQRERQRQFRAYASAHGFKYSKIERLPAELRDLPYFCGRVQMNFGRKIRNTLRGKRAGIETVIFDYWYIGSTTINLPTSRTMRATVICLRLGKSHPWRIFHLDGFSYLEFSQLDWFLGESLKELRANKPAP